MVRQNNFEFKLLYLGLWLTYLMYNQHVNLTKPFTLEWWPNSKRNFAINQVKIKYEGKYYIIIILNYKN